MVCWQAGRTEEAKRNFAKTLLGDTSNASRIIAYLGLVRYYGAKDQWYWVKISLQEIQALSFCYDVSFWILQAMEETLEFFTVHKRHDEAAEIFSLALAAYDRFGNRSKRAEKLRAKIGYEFAASVLVSRKAYEEAIREIEFGSLARYASLGMMSELARCYHQISQAYLEWGKPEEAIQTEEKCWYQLEIIGSASEDAIQSCAHLWQIAEMLGIDPKGYLLDMFASYDTSVDPETYLHLVENKKQKISV